MALPVMVAKPPKKPLSSPRMFRNIRATKSSGKELDTALIVAPLTPEFQPWPMISHPDQSTRSQAISASCKGVHRKQARPSCGKITSPRLHPDQRGLSSTYGSAGIGRCGNLRRRGGLHRLPPRLESHCQKGQVRSPTSTQNFRRLGRCPRLTLRSFLRRPH